MDKSDNKNWMHAKYPHIRIPKALLFGERFPKLSPEAILLYGAMMDRTSLSLRFGGKKFISQNNEVTIIFTQKDIMQLLRCKRDKARSVTRELIDSKLITLKRAQNRGPYIITVIPQVWSDFGSQMKKTDNISLLPMSENPSTLDGKTNISRDDNIGLNNTDLNNLNINNCGKQNTGCFLDADDYERLIAIYGAVPVNRILDVLQSIFSFPPDTICISGDEMEWYKVESLFCNLSVHDFEFALRKLKRAIYTKDHSDAFILDALYTAVMMRS